MDALRAAIAERLVVPETSTSSTPAASSARPPAPVTINAWSAAARAAARSCSKPMSRYDVNPVSSQNTNSVRMLSLRTTPSIAPMNANSEA